ncbi:hypothetical protein SPHINGO8BC_150687 [Sphingobacterium multivorum]|uniref:Uncharacterized protein n=1 Tax=Sphingobacterium multivorum TaxID=28454 RepID=A0A654B0X1_SPHMU|nr:hypothetical protein SPHINGO8BC_150687 [Sphingobacterium multivorum]
MGLKKITIVLYHKKNFIFLKEPYNNCDENIIAYFCTACLCPIFIESTRKSYRRSSLSI